jgi:hypothetical protein
MLDEKEMTQFEQIWHEEADSARGKNAPQKRTVS